MRLTVSSLRRVFNRDLRIEFGSEKLTSYAGLEVVGRFLRRIEFARRVREAFGPSSLGGDYGTTRLVMVVVALLLVGGRRLEHLQYVVSDPLFARFCGLARIPTARTVVNWMKSFTRRSVAALAYLNRHLILDQIAAVGLRRATIDLDGTVLRTGLQVAWARRGYNPHHPKDPSDYPLVAHLAQTGQILRVKNITNEPLSPRALWDFMSGRGAHEKTFSELKNDLAFDVIPTNHYGANSAWQQLSVLAHNLMRGFQLEAGIARAKPRPRERTASYRLLTMKTLRFLLIARAGRLARIGGRRILRLTANPATAQLYDRTSRALAA